MKVALDLADAGERVLLLDAGAADGTSGAPPARADIVNTASHAAMDLAVATGLGGTSKLWGGRAVPFDAIDFMRRGWIAGTEWPLTADEIRPWYETACRFFDCGPPAFNLPFDAAPDDSIMDGLRLGDLERWCARNDMGKVHGERLRSHPNISFLANATVTKIKADAEAGRVTELHIFHNGQPCTVKPRAVVIAAGGIETTRIMLNSQRDAPFLFGGANGPLGRFYMGHAFGSIADIQFLREGYDNQYEFMKDTTGRYVRRRFTLDAQTQARLKLLNMSAWPDLPEIYDPGHGNAILSLAYLALATPVLGRKLMSEAIRLRKMGPGPVQVAPHLWNIIKGAPSAAVFAASFLKARYLSSARIPGFFIRNRAMRYALHFHSEHAPDAESRITLSRNLDNKGVPLARIDLRFGERDADSVLRTHDAMSERMERSGFARIEHRFKPEDRAAAILAQASDGFHQIGTARMSDDPRVGVVDANAKVHGLSNMFLAGSSIFPSSGQANPTLLAVALAARLANHLTRSLPTLAI